MSKTPAQVNLPFSGVNFDSQGINMPATQCTDVLNYRVLRDRLVKRSGCRRVAVSPPSAEPILHTHNYKAANGAEILFGFTATGVYKYLATTAQWTSVTGYTSLSNCEALTGFSTDCDNIRLAPYNAYNSDNPPMQGSHAILVQYEGGVPGNYLKFGGVGVLNANLTSSTKIVFWSKLVGSSGSVDETVPCTFTGYSDDNYTTPIEAINFNLTLTVNTDSWNVPWVETKLTIPTPASWGALKSFTISSTTVVNDFGFLFDYIYATADIASGITHWSTTAITDQTLGATIVAAGSIPPNPTEAESDGADRVLLKYSPLTGLFTALTMTDENGAAVTSKPRFVLNFHDRLVMMNMYDSSDTSYYPWLVQWTEPGEIDKTNLTWYYNQRIDFDISPINGTEALGPYIILYRENSKEIMSYVGGDAIFGFNTVEQNGTYFGRSVARSGNYHFYLGKDSVYRFDGNTSTDIAVDRVRNKIIDLVNVGSVWTTFGHINTFYNEYWLWVTKIGESYPTSVFVYSINRDAWSYFEFEATTCMGYYHTLSGVTINELIGTVNEQNWRMNISNLEGTVASAIMCRATGDVFALDDRLSSDYGYMESGAWVEGSGIPTRLTTVDFIYGDLPRKDRTQRVHFEALGHNTVEVSWSADFGETWHDPQDITLTARFAERKYWPDVVHEHIRFKFETTLNEQFVAIRWIQPFSVTEEKD